MNLTGHEIVRQVKDKKIRIFPFNKRNVNPNSYNYHLSDHLYEINQKQILDPTKKTKTKRINFTHKGYTLRPGRVYLGSTLEIIGSDYFVPSLIGRSSLGRLGLFLQITADLGHLGTCHAWTLELTVVQPLRIYPHMKIGQVTFWSIKGEKQLKYKNGYDSYSIPHISKSYLKENI